MEGLRFSGSTTYIEKGGPFHRMRGADSPSKWGPFHVPRGHFTVDNFLNPQMFVEKSAIRKGGHFTVLRPVGGWV